VLRTSLLAFSLCLACSSEAPRAPDEDSGGAPSGGGTAPGEGGGGAGASSVEQGAGESGTGGAMGEAGAAPDDPLVVPRAESEGCGAMSAYEPGTTTSTLEVAGGSRAFRIHVPPGYDPATPLPVVLMFHGGGGSGRQFQEASADMDPIADREGFITVYPDGTGALRTWNGGGCCGAAVTQNIDDVGFVGALLDHVEASLCVDRNRFFASGMSNGGILSHRLGCELSERLAAIAPVAGTELTSSCSPTRPVAVMHTHGTDDGHVPWAGGQGCGPTSEVDFTAVPETLERWRARNGCAATTSVTFTQGNGSCATYEGCADGADVTLCSIDGGGHSWPGGKPAADLVECPGNGPQSSSFSASAAIWSFFSAHPRRAR
jgi:polyhydroxybutyrate depolymerase